MSVKSKCKNKISRSQNGRCESLRLSWEFSLLLESQGIYLKTAAMGSSVQLLSQVPMDCSMPDFPVHHQLLVMLLKLMFIKSVMPSNHFILCCPLLHPPSIFPSIRVFSKESVRHIRWQKYWSFSFSISPSNDIQDWFPLGWTSWIFLQPKGLSRVFSNTTVQKHKFFGTQLYL